MPLLVFSDDPAINDGVWVELRKDAGGQPNGVVWSLNEDDETITVRFYDGHVEDYAASMFEDKWNAGLNQWVVTDDTKTTLPPMGVDVANHC